MKVLVATDKPFASEAVQGIREVVEQAGHELALLEKYTEKAQLLHAVQTANAMIVRSDIVDAEVMESAPELQLVVRAGAGYDNIDLSAATQKNICVMNTPGQNANAVAELAFGLMVYAARNFFNGTSGNELRGKKLGIHAYGHVGQNVARIAKGFGMELYAFDPFLQANIIESDGLKPLNSENELYSTCQFISLHIPLTAQTNQSVNKKLLSKMPPKGVLINTARKEIIHEAELLNFMEERPDFKYLTDIKPDNHAEMAEKFPTRYVATPKKMGAQTEEANNNTGISAAKQIVEFFQTGKAQFRVN
ncbi:MAG: 3-phosphoglycerate dehydrogenase [Bacteroidales bacterium]|jgi:D-3-phosphoglycerate dehydrogenase|nr:3-phosphoglycerate dehydrogenase [Bacteroidales bacterium]